jgi:hypothetical protein
LQAAEPDGWEIENHKSDLADDLRNIPVAVQKLPSALDVIHHPRRCRRPGTEGTFDLHPDLPHRLPSGLSLDAPQPEPGRTREPPVQ